VSLGTLLDQLESQWNARQKSLALEHKAAKRLGDTEWREYQVQPFPRSEVEAELIRRYPHVAPFHPENPTMRFFAQKGKAAGEELEARAKVLMR
jgi:hypothetical protein